MSEFFNFTVFSGFFPGLEKNILNIVVSPPTWPPNGHLTCSNKKKVSSQLKQETYSSSTLSYFISLLPAFTGILNNHFR